MKKFIATLGIAVLASAAFAQQAELKGKSFGTGVTADSKILAAGKMEQAMGDNKTANLQIQGEVADVCKKKGCWITLKMPNGEPMRVTFKDYAFFMPMDIVGKKVVLDGVAKKQTISVETLRHYAEDANKPAAEVAKITEPKKELAFEAKGVVILDN